jgi:hypothetical protein
VLEFDNGHPLVVFGKKTFMRNVAGHRLRQFDHAVDKGNVFPARAGAQAGTKDSHDHDESPVVQCSRSRLFSTNSDS